MTSEITLPTMARCFVDGRFQPIDGTELVEVLNPSTGDTITHLAVAGADHVDAAVAAARAALPHWSALSRAERGDALARLLTALESRSDDLCRAISLEVGSPLRISQQVQVGLPLTVLRSTIELLRAPEEPEWVAHSMLVHEPVGVVAAITPWNYPLQQTMAKVAGALAAGCTVVHKPSELAPSTAFLLAEAVEEAQLVPGVYNLLPGPGTTTGANLVAHRDVDMISFTGSTTVGRAIAADAGARLVRTSLELGGKSASVVLDGVDLPRAVKATVSNCLLNSGQTCSAWTRLVVPRAALPEAERLAADGCARLTVGDPFDPTTRLGPLISQRQRLRVWQLVQDAVSAGARLVFGSPAAPDGLDRGFFTQPMVLSDVTTDMEIAQTEVFGPVLVVMAHDGEDDAVRIANSSRYGLSGAVWAADDQNALRVARRLRTGQVDVNGAAFNALAPFGGIGDSGHGRELGRYGIAEFTEVKAIQLPAVPDVQEGK